MGTAITYIHKALTSKSFPTIARSNAGMRLTLVIFWSRCFELDVNPITIYAMFSAYFADFFTIFTNYYLRSAKRFTRALV